MNRAQLQPGERVLIHSGAGGVGLAAIQIARQIGATVFATASTAEKRNYLVDQGVDYVSDSSNLEFSEQVLRATEGQGVDVVLNALTGDFLTESFQLLASYGRFIEIGKYDIVQNQGLPMAVFNRNAAFISVDLDRLLLEKPDCILSMYTSSGTVPKALQTPPSACFSAAEVDQAFRLMASREQLVESRLATKIRSHGTR